MVIFVADRNQLADCQAMSHTLDLPIVTEHPEGYHLVYDQQQWVVRDPRQGRHFEIRFDFIQEFLDVARQKINPKKDLLCRAVGFKQRDNHFTVLDGTLGFAKDSLHLLSCGVSVVGFERSALTYQLLKSAWDKAPVEGVDFKFFFGDFKEHWVDWQNKVDCLYLDPMFENTKKKSAPKKHLALLRQISGVDSDISSVIGDLLEAGVKRLVVKRPINGENLGAKPNMQFKGKLVRYDVYTR